MTHTKNITVEQRTHRWFALTRELMLQLVEREDKYLDLFPGVTADPEQQRQAHSDIRRLSGEIERRCHAMAELEPGSPDIGILALTGDADVATPVRAALALIALATMSFEASCRIVLIGELVDLTGSRFSSDCLMVKAAIDPPGILAGHIVYSDEVNRL